MGTALRIFGGLVLLVLLWAGARFAVEVAVIAFDLGDGRSEAFFAGVLFCSLVFRPLLNVMWPDTPTPEGRRG